MSVPVLCFARIEPRAGGELIALSSREKFSRSKTGAPVCAPFQGKNTLVQARN